MNPFKSVKRFYKNIVWNRGFAPAIDNFLGTDLTGDRRATRAEEQRRYEETLRREDTAYLRAAQDMRAAGLNPTLQGINGAAASNAGDPTAGRVNGQGNLGNLVAMAAQVAGAVTNAQSAAATISRVKSQNNKDSHDMLLQSARLAIESKDAKLRQVGMNLQNQLLEHDRDVVFGRVAKGHEPWTYKHGPYQVDPVLTGLGTGLDAFLKGEGIKGAAAEAFKEFVYRLKQGNANLNTIKSLFKMWQSQQWRKTFKDNRKQSEDWYYK